MNDSKKQKMKLLRRFLCKRRAIGPKTRKFRSAEIAKLCEIDAVFLCRPTEIRVNSVGGSTRLLRHRNDSRFPKHDWEVVTVASCLSKIGKEEFAIAV